MTVTVVRAIECSLLCINVYNRPINDDCIISLIKRYQIANTKRRKNDCNCKEFETNRNYSNDTDFYLFCFE